MNCPNLKQQGKKEGNQNICRSMIVRKQESHLNLKPPLLKLEVVLLGRAIGRVCQNYKENSVVSKSLTLGVIFGLNWKISLVFCSVPEEFCNCPSLTILEHI